MVSTGVSIPGSRNHRIRNGLKAPLTGGEMTWFPQVFRYRAAAITVSVTASKRL